MSLNKPKHQWWKKNIDPVELSHVIIESMPLNEIENEDARRRDRKKNVSIYLLSTKN